MRINLERICDSLFFILKAYACNAMVIPAGMLGFGIFKIPAEITNNSRMANNAKLEAGVFFVAWMLAAIPMIVGIYHLKKRHDDINATLKKVIPLYMMINAIMVMAASAMIDPEAAKEGNFWTTAHFAAGAVLTLPLFSYFYQACFFNAVQREHDREPVAVEMAGDIVVGVDVTHEDEGAVEGVVIGATDGAPTLRDILDPADAPAFPRGPY